MLIEVRCPNGHLLHVKEKHAGKIGACPRCSAPVRVPALPQGPAGNGLASSPGTEHSSQDALLHHLRQEHGPTASDSSSSSFFSLETKGKPCLECGQIVSPSFSICSRCGTPVFGYRHLTVRREGEAVVMQFGKHQIFNELSVKEIAEEMTLLVGRTGHRELVLNLARVISLSSYMLGKLVLLEKKLEQDKRRLRLCNVGPELRDVLATTKLDQVLQVDES
jgi:anti-anti-sigma factor